MTRLVYHAISVSLLFLLAHPYAVAELLAAIAAAAAAGDVALRLRKGRH